MSDHITRDDIEAKFRELQGEVDDTVESSVGAGVIAGAAALLVLLLLAFFIGRRKGKRQSTVVEIRRV